MSWGTVFFAFAALLIITIIMWRSLSGKILYEFAFAALRHLVKNMVPLFTKYKKNERRERGEGGGRNN